MSKNNEKNEENKIVKDDKTSEQSDVKTKEISLEAKWRILKIITKILRRNRKSRRRFEKEIKDAFEFGSFNFAKEILATLDNLQRAKEPSKMIF